MPTSPSLLKAWQKYSSCCTVCRWPTCAGDAGGQAADERGVGSQQPRHISTASHTLSYSAHAHNCNVRDSNSSITQQQEQQTWVRRAMVRPVKVSISPTVPRWKKPKVDRSEARPSRNGSLSGPLYFHSCTLVSLGCGRAEQAAGGG